MVKHTNNSATGSSILPVLPQVSIKSPCPMNWDEMVGDAAQRFCGHCQKHVHNFSEMEADTVGELLGSGQSLCAKIRKRSDGSIVTKESLATCEENISRRNWFARLGTLAAGIVAIITLGGCREPDMVEITGIVAPPPVAPAPELLGETDIMGRTAEELGDVELVAPNQVAPSENTSKDILGNVAPVNLKSK